ncbi:MAG: YceI family protein [Alphaproteobacteria bacterium]|nr:YceI family protein [Alphaproteobacteria bacterium]
MSLLLTALSAFAAPYALEPDDSRLYVVVRYDREALVAGHDHVVAATDFVGTVDWEEGDLASCAVSIRFPVTALAVDPLASRGWAGLDGETSDGDKKAITKNMLGRHQLEGDMFPEVSFTSSKCEPAAGGAVVHGTLAIHGVGAPVAAKMRIEADGERLRARGTFEMAHGAWGLVPFSALLGSLRNADPLTFVIDVVGRTPGT